MAAGEAGSLLHPLEGSLDIPVRFLGPFPFPRPKKAVVPSSFLPPTLLPMAGYVVGRPFRSIFFRGLPHTVIFFFKSGRSTFPNIITVARYFPGLLFSPPPTTPVKKPVQHLDEAPMIHGFPPPFYEKPCVFLFSSEFSPRKKAPDEDIFDRLRFEVR